jgi:hypothetical protein
MKHNHIRKALASIVEAAVPQLGKTLPNIEVTAVTRLSDGVIQVRCRGVEGSVPVYFKIRVSEML